MKLITMLNAFNEEPVVAPLGNLLGVGAYEDSPKMIVVTSKSKVGGAIQIAKPEVRKQLVEIFGGSFIILPSSIHELICVDDDPEFYSGYVEMVPAINEAEVNPEDRLSDYVYRYNADADTFQRIRSEDAK